MRGIVELEVLKAIEKKLPRNIPLRSFFDLIVGTRFVWSIFLIAKQILETTLYHYMDGLGFCTV